MELNEMFGSFAQPAQNVAAPQRESPKKSNDSKKEQKKDKKDKDKKKNKKSKKRKAEESLDDLKSRVEVE